MKRKKLDNSKLSFINLFIGVLLILLFVVLYYFLMTDYNIIASPKSFYYH